LRPCSCQRETFIDTLAGVFSNVALDFRLVTAHPPPRRDEVRSGHRGVHRQDLFIRSAASASDLQSPHGHPRAGHDRTTAADSKNPHDSSPTRLTLFGCRSDGSHIRRLLHTDYTTRWQESEVRSPAAADLRPASGVERHCCQSTQHVAFFLSPRPRVRFTFSRWGAIARISADCGRRESPRFEVRSSATADL
jgi:hypothetical protein